MRILVLLMLVSFSSLVHAVTRQDLIGNNSDLTISVSNMAEVIKSIEKSPLGLMWADNEMTGFRNKQEVAGLFKTILTGNRDLKKDGELVHLQWKEKKLLKGEIVLGFNFSSDKTAVSMITELSKSDYLKSIEIDERLFRINKDEPRLHRSKFQGQEIISMHERKTDKVMHWQTWIKNTLLIFENRQDLEKAIVLLRKENIEEPKNKTKIDINCKQGLFNLIKKKAKESPLSTKDNGVDSDNILDAIGFSEISQVALSIDFKDTQCNIELSIGQKGPLAGFWKLFKTSAAPRGKLLAYVPGDIYSYSVNQIDLLSFWQEIPIALTKINPQFLLMYNFYLDSISKSIQIDLSKEVFENLSPLVVSYGRMQGLEDQTLYAIKLHNEDSMIRTLAKSFGPESPISVKLASMLSQDDVNGITIYNLRVPSKKIPNKMDTYAITVSNSYLLIGNPSFVRGMIGNDSNGKEFYQSKNYNIFMDSVSKKASSYAYSDISKMIGPVVQELHSNGVLKALGPNKNAEAKSPVDDFFNHLDPSKLPDAKFFNKYLGLGYSDAVWSKGHLVSKMVLKYASNGVKK